MDWQPIATFPKTGEYLCYDPVADKFDVCRWLPELRRPDAVQQDGLYGPFEDEFQGARATHWAVIRGPQSGA